MRPVERGNLPDDGAGSPKSYAEHTHARADLLTRIGRYCSYCERPIKTHLAVEHVLPKDLPQFAAVKRDWSNFLLACVNCNSTKGKRPLGRRMQFLPDQDNTFRALLYSVGGRVAAHPARTPAEKRKATLLIKLVGLDKMPTHDPEAKDLRWNDRREAWDKATRYHAKYQAEIIGVDEVVDLCKADGHWSIWMTVFAAITAVRLALIRAHPGTAACFDAQGDPVARVGGQI